MVNRMLIRVKVVQIMYDYYISRGVKVPSEAVAELTKSLDASYELYNNLLRLIVDITYLQDRDLDEARYRYGATDEDRHPDRRFVDIELAQRLSHDEKLCEFIKAHPFSWLDDEMLARHILQAILNSDLYNEYMRLPATDRASEYLLWRRLFKDVILPDEELLEALQTRSIYLGEDDLETMGDFVVKTIKRFEHNEIVPLLPQYKDEEDELFGPTLLRDTINNIDINNELIDHCVKTGRWSSDRLAVMDRVIMLVALTELRSINKIPTAVTLNEYIELAKCFSTRQSGPFVNGVLMAALNNLRSNGGVVKP